MRSNTDSYCIEISHQSHNNHKWSGLLLVTYRWSGLLLVTDRWSGLLLVTYKWSGLLLVTYKWSGLLLDTYKWSGLLLVTDKWSGLLLVTDKWSGLLLVTDRWSGLLLVTDKWSGLLLVTDKWSGNISRHMVYVYIYLHLHFRHLADALYVHMYVHILYMLYICRIHACIYIYVYMCVCSGPTQHTDGDVVSFQALPILVVNLLLEEIPPAGRGQLLAGQHQPPLTVHLEAVPSSAGSVDHLPVPPPRHEFGDAAFSDFHWQGEALRAGGHIVVT